MVSSDDVTTAASAHAQSAQVADVAGRAEDLHQFLLVVFDAALHEVFARAEEPLERLHVQHCNSSNKPRHHTSRYMYVTSGTKYTGEGHTCTCVYMYIANDKHTVRACR